MVKACLLRVEELLKAVMRLHCFWLASSATQIFMVDVCKLERRGNVNNYADDAFNMSREIGRRPKGVIGDLHQGN